MQKQRGNFLLQALLALTLAFVFMPFFASKLALRDMNAKIHSATLQIEHVYDAAINFLRENKNNLNYGTVAYEGELLVQVLQHYGLPLGFINETVFGQSMSLLVNKQEEGISANIKVSGGNLSDMQIAELIRRLDLYAVDEGDGFIKVFVPVDASLVSYTDIVLKNEPEDGIFLSELNMAGNDITGLGGLGSEITDEGTNGAMNAEFDDGVFKKIMLVAEEAHNVNSPDKNMISRFVVDGTTDVYNFLNIAGSNVSVSSKMNVNYVSPTQEGFYPTLTATDMRAREFMMLTDYVNFTGPDSVASIGGNFSAPDFTLLVHNTSNGALAQINSDIIVAKVNSSFETVHNNGGIAVDDMIVENIVVGQSGYSDLKSGVQSGIILKISPAGVSEFNDVRVATINNDPIQIIQNPASSSPSKKSCALVFDEKSIIYNKNSLAQHIMCQYLFWERLEHRVKIKNNTWH